MARSIRLLLAAAALVVTVTADRSTYGPHYGHGYSPYSYSYGIHQPYRQQTNVYQHGNGYGHAQPYGSGYAQPYGSGYPHSYGYPYGYGQHYRSGYGPTAYSHVKYSGYPAGYAFNVAHSKVHPNKYAEHRPIYGAYKPTQFGYTSTVVHPAVAYLKPAVMNRNAEEKPDGEAEAMADGASGAGMMAEEAPVEKPASDDGQ